MSDKLGPRDTVPCPGYAGNPRLPAESCVMRSLWMDSARNYEQPTYPICAACPLAPERRAALEAGGWTWDPEAFRARERKRLTAEWRARRTHRLTHLDPGSEVDE